MGSQNNFVRIFDTTLRDGEQSPGASLNTIEKLAIARKLEELGVDIIEAGFPITSQGDFEAVQAISQELSSPVIAGLARCIEADVRRAGEAVNLAQRGRIHVFCATSRIHLEHKLKKAFDEIVRISVEHVKLAREYVEDVEFSPEDGSRTEVGYLVDIVGAVIEAGATTINIPDTVGYAVPSEYGAIFAELRNQLPEIDRKGIILSSHCHNDLGLAVANSLSAVENGARQVECTINGLGERAGNASLEEVVMALRTRQDYYKLETNIDTKQIYSASRMVANLTGISVQRNKAVVGENAFAHEAGIHQDGILKERTTYEIMDPQEVGIPTNKLVLGKHSGRHAFKERLDSLGYLIEGEIFEQSFVAFKDLADKKKNVYDEDIEAIIEHLLNKSHDVEIWSLEQLQVTSGSSAMPTATVVLSNGEGGQELMDASTGDGPVDAAYSAIQRITGVKAKLLDYNIKAISRGKDAQGEVMVEVEYEDKKFRGRGVSTDIVEASARAYLSAVNRVAVSISSGDSK